MTNASGVKSRLEVGFGSSPEDFSLFVTWTDVSSRVVDGGPVVSCVSGRGWREGLTPGALTARFADVDGWWAARSDLTVGTHVRLCVQKADLSWWPVWSGYAASWQFSGSESLRVLELQAHDWIGYAGQVPSPSCAWDAVISALPAWKEPSHWWRAGATGWIDLVSGFAGRHSGSLVESEPVVDGDSKPGGQVERDGIGVMTVGVLDPFVTSESHAFALWFRLSLPDGGSTILFESSRGVESATDLPIRRGVALRRDGETDVLEVYEDDGSFHRQWQMVVPANFDIARPHWLVVAWPGAGWPSLWLDGVELAIDMAFSTAGSGVDLGDVVLRVGGGSPGSVVAYAGPYSGVIDHVMEWEYIHLSYLKELIAAGWSAGFYGWSGQSMDERAESLVGVSGVSPTYGFGAPVASAVRTLQGYRGDSSGLLSALQTVEDTEQGLMSVNQFGMVLLFVRSWAWTFPRSTSVMWSFAETQDPLDGVVTLDKAEMTGSRIGDVVNRVGVNSSYGRQQIVEDAASVSAYGVRAGSDLSGLLHPSDRSSRSIAAWIVYQRSQPVDGVLGVVVDTAAMAPADAVLFVSGVTIGDLVSVMVDGVELFAHVRSISHEVGPNRHVVSLGLDPDRAGRSWVEVGDPIGSSELIAF